MLTLLSYTFAAIALVAKIKSIVLAKIASLLASTSKVFAVELFVIFFFLQSLSFQIIKMFGIQTQKLAASYNPVKTEDCEGLLANSETSSLDGHPSKAPPRRPSWIATCTIVLGTAVLSALFGAWAGRNGLDADAFSLRHISQYCMFEPSRCIWTEANMFPAPVVKEADMTFSQVRFNGSFLKLNAFRQDAGPEVDAAWKSLGADFTAVRIPASEAAQSNIRADQVKIKQKYGGGFPANVEGLHHLHCLNLLRKALPWNIEYYKAMKMGPFANDDHILKAHVSKFRPSIFKSNRILTDLSLAHCLDIIRQQLMCNVDIGVLGQVWYQPPNSHVEPFVDFNTVHTCRNFEAVRDWAEKHQLPDETPEDFLEGPKPGDRIYLEVP